MIRKNKKALLLSSAVTLLPMVLGLLLWNRLPEQIATHWGADGNVDGWSGRGFAVFGMPLILLAGHWLSILITARDPKNRDQNRKVFGMTLWILPMLSFFICGSTYAVALGKTFHISEVTLLLMGLMFVIIGNYLPKCKQNYTIGIKVKWALANEENWNATHRFSGKLWVAGGLLMMACMFLPGAAILWSTGLLLTALVAAPILYSYTYYKKQVKAGTAPEKAVVPMDPWAKRIVSAAMVITAVILVVVLVICFTGNITLAYSEDRFAIQASYRDDLTVAYDAIETLEYRERFDPGFRVFGFGSPRLSMGTFQNEEFGNYTLYAYTGCDAAVILRTGSRTLALSGKNARETQIIYEELTARCSLN